MSTRFHLVGRTRQRWQKTKVRPLDQVRFPWRMGLPSRPASSMSRPCPSTPPRRHPNCRRCLFAPTRASPLRSVRLDHCLLLHHRRDPQRPRLVHCHRHQSLEALISRKAPTERHPQHPIHRHPSQLQHRQSPCFHRVGTAIGRLRVPPSRAASCHAQRANSHHFPRRIRARKLRMQRPQEQLGSPRPPRRAQTHSICSHWPRKRKKPSGGNRLQQRELPFTAAPLTTTL